MLLGVAESETEVVIGHCCLPQLPSQPTVECAPLNLFPGPARHEVGRPRHDKLDGRIIGLGNNAHNGCSKSSPNAACPSVVEIQRSDGAGPPARNHTTRSRQHAACAVSGWQGYCGRHSDARCTPQKSQ